jgi:thiamine biosynthesis lipoprotein
VSGEAHRAFRCFGGTVTIHLLASDPGEGEALAATAEARLLDAHDRLSRFIEESELSRLNRDPRPEVPVSPLMSSLANAARMAGARSGGLVDATLIGELERAGYRDSFGDREPLPLAEALSRHEARAAARPSPARRWSQVQVDEEAGTVTRPPGVRLDGGGIAKGLLADLLAATLRGHRAYAVDCCGDIRVGGSTDKRRRVLVGDPFGGEPIHELRLSEGAAATSGIGRRCWIGPDGQLAHHILDPGRGKPAFTGVVQATAIAPSALLAEVHAKAALLSGPERAAEWLPHGGVIVLDGGEVEVVHAERPLPRTVALR